ncbi:MAG: hypothetical protein F6K30_23165 [Cyanothece sp. SIO2G6]|nr:hypothetical protein [Cyanothece sp. SIO2G6]
MTGPIYVEEAEPGDVLEIRLEAIKPSFPMGFTPQQLQLGAKTYQAQVISTLPQVDSVTRTSTVILRLPAAATGEVRAGQITRLSLSKTISESGYWLPMTALVKEIRGNGTDISKLRSLKVLIYRRVGTAHQP